jgi:hypothetical protein
MATAEAAKAHEATPPAPPAAKPEAPRRRSTVREPAPFVRGTPAPLPSLAIAQEVAQAVAPDITGAEPAPPPPAPTEPAPLKPAPVQAHPESVTPRRAGWWAKRLLGERG